MRLRGPSDVVEDVHVADSAVAVAELYVETFDGMREIQMEQVSVLLEKQALSIGDGYLTPFGNSFLLKGDSEGLTGTAGRPTRFPRLAIDGDLDGLEDFRRSTA